MKKIFTGIVIVALAGVLIVERGSIRQYISTATRPQLPPAVGYNDIQPVTDLPVTNSNSTPTKPVAPTPKPATNPASQPTNTTPPVAVKSEINLAVPFQPQAPFADWSEPYENACEEASIIMVDYYLRGATLSKQQMKDAIDAQVAWQIAHFGGHVDMPMAQEKELALAFYTYHVEVIDTLTVAKIKEQLNLGRPVIIPAAGQELGNPNFTGAGPLYHMLVIKGYTADGKFITNDPGTRNGADYVYTSSVLMNGINDWSGTGLSGRKTGLVMYK